MVKHDNALEKRKEKRNLLENTLITLD